MKEWHNFLFHNSYKAARGKGDRGYQAKGLSCYTAFSEEIARPQKGKNRFFALGRYYRKSDSSILDIIDRICSISHCKKDLALTTFQTLSILPRYPQKGLDFYRPSCRVGKFHGINIYVQFRVFSKEYRRLLTALFVSTPGAFESSAS